MRFFIQLLRMTGMILLFASCGNKDSAFTANNVSADSIIPRDQMIRMLTEIHLLEAALQQERKKENDREMAVFYYTHFFSGYRMSEKRFKNNLDAYQSDVDEFLKMYEEVIRNLEKKTVDLKNLPPGKK